MKTRRKIFIRIAVIVACLAVVAFVGAKLYDALYEPERCALCGDGVNYHAPVILNLSTGELVELQVYEPHPYLVGEIAKVQPTGYTRLSLSAGIMMYADAGKSCRATLPENTRRMKRTLYSKECRKLLSAVNARGYVLLDLYNLDDIHAYPITAGAAYEIRDYTVTVATDEYSNGLSIEATGHLLAG